MAALSIADELSTLEVNGLGDDCDSIVLLFHRAQDDNISLSLNNSFDTFVAYAFGVYVNMQHSPSGRLIGRKLGGNL
jgi:hypothetical protein